MKEHFRQLFAYDSWANEKIIKVLIEQQIRDEKILSWLSHIISAQQVWLARLVKTDEPKVWEQRTLKQCVEAFEKCKNGWQEYLKSTNNEEFYKTVTYRNTKGDEFSNQLKDILTHAINHSTYHRGQITAVLKGLHNEIPYTDYIFYLRQ